MGMVSFGITHRGVIDGDHTRNMVLAFLFTHTFAGSGKEPFTQIASYFTGTNEGVDQGFIHGC